MQCLVASDWDSVTAGSSIFLSRRYLQTAQNEFANQIVRDFGLIYRDGVPVAAVATQSFDVVGNQLIGDQLDQKIKLPSDWKRKSLSLLKRRIMICGNVHTWGLDGVAFADGQDPAKLWQGVADCLYRIRRANRLHGQTDYVIVKDLAASDRPAASTLGSYRYQAFETEPNMVLTIPQAWHSFDDYLASLTKRYRGAARKVLKPFVDGTLTISNIENPAEQADQIYALYKAVAARADVCLFSLQPTTLPRMAESLGDDFVTIGIRQDETLVGFVTVVRDAETAVGFYLGLNYQVNSNLPIYHRLLLAVIEQAIQWQCRHISFGRTALEAKSRLGCQPEATHVWVRHRVPIVNFVVQQLLKNVTHAEPPDRNPFKDVQ
ncbi:GNAT family N-acetyltransferase [Stieleria sp. TO1_6]|uniref:GNAT family N-acetyltransferase n=1 Tax=Stieleria tagensis TaxID=2956795 RepID=UPI00209B7338|nr:GNAT family N-acetyltransferase [Stieleria tagensis]MCO8125404.1 GNAT family N-acetyltransferase [Stieleria tagensis]